MQVKSLLRKLYDLIPGKKFLFLLLRRFVSLPEPVYRHLHFRGSFNVKIDKATNIRLMHYGYVLENEIFWKGMQGWEGASEGIWVELCKCHSCIVDVGANTGIYSLIAKGLNSGANVIAIEPVERVFKKLLHNIALNKMGIDAICAAVSSRTGEGVIYDNPSLAHVLSVSLNEEFNSWDDNLVPVPVKLTTLDKIVEEYGINIDLLKIDTETHEPQVLKGYSKYLSKHKPSMIIEVLNEDIAGEINELIAGMDYCIFNIDEEKGPVRQSEVTKSRDFNFLLCQPSVAKRIGLL